MDIKNLIGQFEEDTTVISLCESLQKGKTSIRIKGIAGSSDALVSGLVTRSLKVPSLFILHDREEADYFLQDIEQLFPEIKCHLFPSSYKKPYQYEETENANILQRAEVLNHLNQKRKEDPFFIISYPEALSEKVINKRSLIEHTFSISVGEKLDTDFITEFLTSYDFEKSDFVYEPGQFAIRGGIIDIFSFSRDHPFRVELFGDEVESVREFDVESQLSTDDLEKISIIPNVQTRLLKEERQSFLEYLPDVSLVWIKDYREMVDLVDKSFDKVTESFEEILKASGRTQVISDPEILFVKSAVLRNQLEGLRKLEFGKRYYLSAEETFQFDFKPQPNFNKNFDLLAENLNQLQDQEFKNYILADSYRQIERLKTIFEEVDPGITIDGLVCGIREGFIDPLNRITLYTDHQIFDRYHRAKKKEKFTRKKALTLREVKNLQTGDYVVHVDYGVARFAGLDTVDVGGRKQEAMRLVFRDDDLLYVSIHSLHKVSKYSGKEGSPPTVNKLGTQEWENKKKKVKRKVKDIAKDLIELYAKRKAAHGFNFPKDNFLQAELESSFIYEDTPDQASSTSDVKEDMEQPHPMDRLVCGDVGFGKTEVAIRAAFKAVNSGKQVAVLVPTTVLAMQHYHTFRERLKNFPVQVDYVNRFKSTKEISRVKKEINSGAIDILIGTHRIVNKDIEFKDLGLMIIDEEQKFGVKVKERLKEMRVNVDALTLTATPIPRTLHFFFFFARDLSIISTPPPNRRPVTTEIHVFGEEVIRDAISHEIRRGGQVFFVHNKISDIENLANIVYRLVPDARIGIAHGQMEGKQLEKVMLKFIEGEYDVLVSTNIIESGLDIPNANTIIINRAHMFGLSDLHQMRGRVGRSNTQAYCYLLTPPASGLSSDARKRLTTLEEFSDLGDGFKVAMRDLDIRGAGNLLGSEQSGFINDMGFDMYHKILDEAVHELKETEFRDLFENELLKEENLQNIKEDCQIETDLEILIPHDYVNNTSERLQLYTRLDNISHEDKLEEFRKSLIDRFGPLPDSVVELIKSVKLRWKAIKLGMEKVVLKNETLRCYISDQKDPAYFQSDVFGGLLQFAQANGKICSMREAKNKLIFSVKGVDSIEKGISTLEQMMSQVQTVDS